VRGAHYFNGSSAVTVISRQALPSRVSARGQVYYSPKTGQLFKIEIAGLSEEESDEKTAAAV
jgi:hypothetical protein